MRRQEHWAAILAGGEGRRLRPLTRSVVGDARPKQFCRLFGTNTLLGETRARVYRNVAAERTLYVVSRAHETFYRDELQDVADRQLIEQPSNRGTTAAVAAALLRLRHLGTDGVLGLFPADHYYRDEAALQLTVAAAYRAAADAPERVVVVGVEATRPETEYGWIEPGPVLARKGGRPAAGDTDVRAVFGFREKPCAAEAVRLQHRGGLWSTMIVVARVCAFEKLLAEAVPDVWHDFTSRGGEGGHEAGLRAAYAAVRPSDFSHEVLATCSHRLSVITLPGGGWTDLGRPHRVLDVLAERRQVIGPRAAIS